MSGSGSHFCGSNFVDKRLKNWTKKFITIVIRESTEILEMMNEVG